MDTNFRANEMVHIWNTIVEGSLRVMSVAVEEMDSMVVNHFVAGTSNMAAVENREKQLNTDEKAKVG